MERETSPFPSVEIYTDGACQGNPGPGGWAAILVYKDHEKEAAGYAPLTTNNRMEMMAAIEGIRALKHKSNVKLYTDSTYLKEGMTKWLHGWKAKQWLKADKTPVKNIDLWQMLDELSQHHEITWHWVRGHSGHIMNERVDLLARTQITLHAPTQNAKAGG